MQIADAGCWIWRSDSCWLLFPTKPVTFTAPQCARPTLGSRASSIAAASSPYSQGDRTCRAISPNRSRAARRKRAGPQGTPLTPSAVGGNAPGVRTEKYDFQLQHTKQYWKLEIMLKVAKSAGIVPQYCLKSAARGARAHWAHGMEATSPPRRMCRHCIPLTDDCGLLQEALDRLQQFLRACIASQLIRIAN